MSPACFQKLHRFHKLYCLIGILPRLNARVTSKRSVRSTARTPPSACSSCVTGQFLKSTCLRHTRRVATSVRPSLHFPQMSENWMLIYTARSTPNSCSQVISRCRQHQLHESRNKTIFIFLTTASINFVWRTSELLSLVITDIVHAAGTISN